MRKKINVWEGIYDNFQHASSNATGPGFNGDIWLKRSIHTANECLDALKMNKPIPFFYKQRSTLLAPIAAMMLENTEKLRILDFGGGLGIGYMILTESIPWQSERISYTIIEIPQICEAGRRLFIGNNGITYLASLPLEGEFSLLYSASALQYIEDWQAVIKSLSNYGAKYILLSDVFAGSISTFVTLQNYYGNRIRHWFFNFKELLDTFSLNGYQLIMKSFVNSRTLGVEGILPMDNFPQSHRLEQSSHLLLKRSLK